MVGSSRNNLGLSGEAIYVYSRRRGRATPAASGRIIPAPSQPIGRSVLDVLQRSTFLENRILAEGQPDPVGSSEADASSSSGSDEEVDEEENEGRPPSQEVPMDVCSPEGDGSMDMSLTLTDATVLDCPICTFPLSPPVYQCAEGHVACDSCWRRTRNKCSYCQRIGVYRCRAVERILESVKASCHYKQQGCQETFSYDVKRAHEESCYYAPYPCPVVACSYVAQYKQIYAHFDSMHSPSAKQFLFNSPTTISVPRFTKSCFLQETNEKVLFILYNVATRHGNWFTVVCFAPVSSERVFTFDLSASAEGSLISLKSQVENMTEISADYRGQSFLMVPRKFATADVCQTVELTIWNQHE